MRIWNIAYVSVKYLTLKLKEVKMQIESLIFILFPKEKLLIIILLPIMIFYNLDILKHWVNVRAVLVYPIAFEFPFL